MYRDTFGVSFVGGIIGIIVWLGWAGNEFDWHYAPEFEIIKFIICVGGGVFIGGAGLVSAGVGIGVPMIPIGIYIIYRGYNKVKGNTQILFEKTPIGKILLGILLIIIAVGTGGSALIAIAIFGGGGYLIYRGIKKYF